MLNLRMLGPSCNDPDQLCSIPDIHPVDSDPFGSLIGLRRSIGPLCSTASRQRGRTLSNRPRGDDRASRDAADRQAALAEIREIAERYVRLRSATLLLQWAIDRYPREKQAPMLKRAGELFAILTGGSFESLQLEFDQQDNVHLAGIRQQGGRVPVSGMSTGTADQLYLALRIAAVEDYLGHATPLPFVADDLFINFDDDRAGAGFRVLSQLAQKTQVLFFTHHQHLVEVAKQALGTSLFTCLLY